MANVLDQLRRGRYLTAVPGARYAVANFPASQCASKPKGFCAELDTLSLALGWLRVRAGLPHGLPPALAGRLDGFDPDDPSLERRGG